MHDPRQQVVLGISGHGCISSFLNSFIHVFSQQSFASPAVCQAFVTLVQPR